MRCLVHDLLGCTASVVPDKTALICGDCSTSFAELARSVAGLARTLQEAGVRRGDRVMLLMDNGIEMVEAVFASLAAGAVFVPVHPATKPEKLAFLIEDCAPRVLVAHRVLAPVVRAAVPSGHGLSAIFWAGAAVPPQPAIARLELTVDEAAAQHDPPVDPGLIDNDLAAIIYTSGSTGAPKGVMLTHRNICNTAWAIATYLDNRPDDVVVCTLPLSFGYGLYQVLTGVRVGFTIVLERPFVYPWHLLNTMATHRVTGLPAVPTIFAKLVQLAPFNGLDLSSLRYLTNAAAPLPPAHIKRLREMFPQAHLFSMYGLTECTRVSYLDPARLDDKPESVGKAMPNSEAYIVGEDGRRLPPGEVGELVVRGANVMRGYWRNPQATAARLRDGDTAGEKVLHTGDLFRMDEEGFLYFVGRQDDIFKCRGEKVSPKEVEHVLCELAGVAEAAVVGVPDPVDGMAVKALVVPKEGATLTESQIKLHCRARLESHLVPRFIELRAALPRSENGKVRRGALAQAAEAQSR